MEIDYTDEAQQRFDKLIHDDLHRQQLQADEAAMQPLLIRLDEIIMLLKEVLEKM